MAGGIFMLVAAALAQWVRPEGQETSNPDKQNGDFAGSASVADRTVEPLNR
jgi:hypothetical protein